MTEVAIDNDDNQEVEILDLQNDPLQSVDHHSPPRLTDQA